MVSIDQVPAKAPIDVTARHGMSRPATVTLDVADLDALLSILVAPDGRAILTHRPTRDRDEREARRRARDTLLDMVAGRRLSEGERLDAIRRACGPLTAAPGRAT
jgi:hypothetical protein